MKNNVIKFTVNPFTSLENIMKQVNSAAEGKIIDGIFVERKSFFKSEVEVLVSVPKVIYIDKPIIQEVIKEVPVEVVKEVEVIKEVLVSPKTIQPSVKSKSPYSSQYRGVTKKGSHYEAMIGHNKKRIWIGSYTSELDAARAYNAKAVELKGKNAILNVIDIDTPVAN